MNFSDWIGAMAAFGVLVAVWWPVRLAIAQRVERRFEESNPRNSDGIIIGAEPTRVRGVRPGAVLLLHGYNDSPQTVRSLAAALHDFGWTVHAPVLAGHARTLQAFAQSGATEWMDGVRSEYRELRAHHEVVAVGGMSMGGALALLLAAEQADVRAVFGVASFLNVTLTMRAVVAVSAIAGLGARYVSGGGGRSVHDPEAARNIIAYRMSTPRLVRELEKIASSAVEALPRIHQPVLFVQSREDNRIPVRSTVRAFDRIASRDKSLDWVTGAGHVLTVDYGHERLERRIIEWLSARM